jgi:Pyruvate/2-oxoacid:ferredoxin oxidoreductase gamma subunit
MVIICNGGIDVTYNILIGGSAGQGVETVSAIFEKILKRQGYEIFTVKDYMSRVRGGHNFVQVRFGSEKIFSHRDELDGIIALNAEAIESHINRLSSRGFIICDEEINYDDSGLLCKSDLLQAGGAGGLSDYIRSRLYRSNRLDSFNTRYWFRLRL